MAETATTAQAVDQTTAVPTTPVEDDSKKTWWVEYDPETFKYVRNVRAVEQPANTTAKEPTGLENAVYDPKTDTWSGNSIEEKFKKLREAAEAKQAEEAAQQEKEKQEQQSVQEQIKNLTMMIVTGGGFK